MSKNKAYFVSQVSIKASKWDFGVLPNKVIEYIFLNGQYKINKTFDQSFLNNPGEIKLCYDQLIFDNEENMFISLMNGKILF